MERPALQRLLADIKARRIDVVVVYKIDRLTRSLIDFAKMVDVFDGAGASFVSITQSFNTTTSMGRLTLNVLLSFAQFEREVISERVRDKIAASKAKGLWMGGSVALGYDAIDRKLVPNSAETTVVRDIYQRYLDLGSVRELLGELRRRNIRTKRQTMRDGSIRGGELFRRGTLHHMLKNRLYVGEIVHKGRFYPGEHAAIIDRELFDAVQSKLAEGAPAVTHAGENSIGVLAGMIRDANDRPLSPHHTTKGGKRYRYYCSNAATPAERDQTWRLPAAPLEKAVLDALERSICSSQLLPDHAATADAQILTTAAPAFMHELRAATPRQQKDMLRSIGVRLRIGADDVDATCSRPDLLRMLGVESTGVDDQRVALHVPVIIRRKGQETRLIVRSPISNRDPQMIRHLRLAQIALKRLNDEPRLSIAERRELVRAARLSYLAPDIVGRILDGRQPDTLTARHLQRVGDLPLCWAEQRRMLGIV